MIPCFELLQKPMWEKSACNDGREREREEWKATGTKNTPSSTWYENWKLMAMIAKHYMKWMSDSNLIEYMWPNPETILYILNNVTVTIDSCECQWKWTNRWPAWSHTCITYQPFRMRLYYIYFHTNAAFKRTRHWFVKCSVLFLFEVATRKKIHANLHDLSSKCARKKNDHFSQGIVLYICDLLLLLFSFFMRFYEYSCAIHL